MKKKHQKELFFNKETIAVLNNNELTKILGGSDVDTSNTSEFYSDGPPLTTLDISG